jgi:hypothetical protein
VKNGIQIHITAKLARLDILLALERRENLTRLCRQGVIQLGLRGIGERRMRSHEIVLFAVFIIITPVQLLWVWNRSSFQYGPTHVSDMVAIVLRGYAEQSPALFRSSRHTPSSLVLS